MVVMVTPFEGVNVSNIYMCELERVSYISNSHFYQLILISRFLALLYVILIIDMDTIEQLRPKLLARIKTLDHPRDILKADEFKQLYAKIPTLAADEKAHFGKAVNELRLELEAEIAAREAERENASVEPIDVTAPWDVNANEPQLLPTEQGTRHPLTIELERVIDIFTRMGFEAHESRQIDDDWNMFGALNFPENHPARDGYDSFRTEEGFIPYAHTSTMQNRVLKAGKAKLEAGGYIASVS